MASEQASDGSTLRYAADDKPPLPFSIVVGIQTSLLACIPVVVVTTVVAQVANQSEAYLRWAVFASIVIGGLTTVVQARRPGGVGAGTLTVMGASGAATGVAVLALVAGGPPLLGVLVVASALGQFVFASRLALLRRIITPTLSGILLVLIAVTVVPLGFEMLSRVPAAAPATAAPTVALATVATVVALVFKAPRILRAWTPVLGIAAGCVVAALFGIFDLGRVREASWVGLPEVAFPGLDLGFDSRFWVLLPGFLFVSFVITVRQVGDTVLMQRASHRDPRAIDFRRVQGGVVACGAGTLLSGLAGVLPPWPFAAGKVLASGAGVAARRIGVFVGTIFLALAFVPKLTTLIFSIPPPVLGSYIIIFFGSVFAEGMRVIFRGLIDQRNAMIIGFSFWIGVGVQLGAIFPDYLVAATGGLPVDGLTAGGLTYFTLNLLLALAGVRRRRTEIPLLHDSQPLLDRFVLDFAKRNGWDDEAARRLRAASEEALLSLLREEKEPTPQDEGRQLRVVVWSTRSGAELEFTAAPQAGNVENQILHLGDPTDPPSDRDLSLVLLRYYASSVRHRQYHNVDILKVGVDREVTASVDRD